MVKKVVLFYAELTQISTLEKSFTWLIFSPPTKQQHCWFSPLFQINIDCGTRENITKNISQPTLTSFDSAQKLIYSLMARDCYPRFLKSDVYQGLLRRTEASWLFLLQFSPPPPPPQQQPLPSPPGSSSSTRLTGLRHNTAALLWRAWEAAIVARVRWFSSKHL